MPLPFQLPPLAFTGGSAGPSSSDMWGGSFGGGDWVVNVAGSGKSNQSASATAGISWVMVAAAVGAAWLLLKK